MAFLMRAGEVWRDFVTAGVPSSGKWDPKKADIRAWGTWVEGVVSAFFSTGGKIYQTRARMDADLTPTANSIAWVMQDTTVANNGIYRKVGGAGTGSWARAGDLPYSFIVSANLGAGTANAIQATTSIPVSPSALVILPVAATNTSSPVTVSFNGGDAILIKTASGNDIVAGGLIAGMHLAGIVAGSSFRLLSDQASAAVLAQMEQLLIDTAAESAQMVADAVQQFTDQTQDLRDEAQASADNASSSATEAAMYAEMVGAAVYDFNFDTDPSTPGLDWNN